LLLPPVPRRWGCTPLAARPRPRLPAPVPSQQQEQ
jgi:hypothetical protein